jgi:hypothetical protein
MSREGGSTRKAKKYSELLILFLTYNHFGTELGNTKKSEAVPDETASPE